MNKEVDKIRETIQEGLEDYTLKTDLELINSIIDFGCGELKFHTADIERLIKEKEYYKTQLTHLTKENKMLYVGIAERKNTIEGFLKNKGLEREYMDYVLNED